MGDRRTGGMTALAIINFVFAALQIGAGLVSLLATHAAMSRTFQTESASLFMQVLGLGLLSVAVGAFGIAAGVGILKVAGWGRVMCFVYAGAWIFMQCIDALWTSSHAKETADRLGGLIGAGIWLVYPVILILLCVKPSWRKAFAADSAVPPVA